MDVRPAGAVTKIRADKDVCPRCLNTMLSAGFSGGGLLWVKDLPWQSVLSVKFVGDRCVSMGRLLCFPTKYGPACQRT